jgi:hypothetical protein
MRRVSAAHRLETGRLRDEIILFCRHIRHFYPLLAPHNAHSFCTPSPHLMLILPVTRN